MQHWEMLLIRNCCGRYGRYQIVRTCWMMISLDSKSPVVNWHFINSCPRCPAIKMFSSRWKMSPITVISNTQGNMWYKMKESFHPQMQCESALYKYAFMNTLMPLILVTARILWWYREWAKSSLFFLPLVTAHFKVKWRNRCFFVLPLVTAEWKNRNNYREFMEIDFEDIQVEGRTMG